MLIDTAIAQGFDAEKAQSLRMIFKQRKVEPEEAAEMIREEMEKDRNRGEQQIVDVDELANHLLTDGGSSRPSGTGSASSRGPDPFPIPLFYNAVKMLSLERDE